MYGFGTQRLGPSPLAGPSQHAGTGPSPSHHKQRNNSLDPVPEDSSLGRKRSLRSQQAQFQKDQARAARRRSEVGGSIRRMSVEMAEQDMRRSPLFNSNSSGLLSPRSKPGRLPSRELLEPPSPTPVARPGRALSEARVTLERERQRVERNKTRPDWVIDLDDMEVGIKEWTRPTKSRVILMLGEPSPTALKPVLTSPDFTNTLILLARNPSAVPTMPVASSSSPTKDSSRPVPGLPVSNRTSRQFGQRHSSSPNATLVQTSRSPLSQLTSTSPPGDKKTNGLDAKDLVATLGSTCLAEVQFLPTLKEGKTIGDVVKQAVDAALAWRKKRKLLATTNLDLQEPTLLGLGSRRGSSHSDQVAMGSRSHSPLHSRRPSVELLEGRDRRSTLSRSFSSVLSMATVINKEDVETASQDGSVTEPNQRVRALDAVVNFLPAEERADSLQGTLQNVLVTTTALLPFMPSSIRMSPTDSTEEKKRRNSAYSLVSSARTSSFSSNIFPVGVVDMPQTLVHVLPPAPSPALIKATESYLKSLFPRPTAESLSAHVAPRAFVLGSRVLGQPMKRASDMSPISGLALMLSGAVSCHSHHDKTYLDDLRSCRFELGPHDRSDEEERNPDLASSAFFDPYSVATGITDSEAKSIRSLEPPRLSSDNQSRNDTVLPDIQDDSRREIPTTPPLDYDNETSASSGDNSTHSRSVEGFNTPDVVTLSPSVSSSHQEVAKTLKKKKSRWLGKLFNKGETG